MGERRRKRHSELQKATAAIVEVLDRCATHWTFGSMTRLRVLHSGATPNHRAPSRIGGTGPDAQSGLRQNRVPRRFPV